MSHIPSPLPESPSTPRPKGWATVLATIFVGAFVLGCIELISPPFAIAILCFAALLLLQYLLWGWWLSALLPRDPPRPDEQGSQKL